MQEIGEDRKLKKQKSKKKENGKTSKLQIIEDNKYI